MRKAAEDEEAIWEAVRQVADEALAGFVAMREREGARMREDVLARRQTILRAVEQVEARSPEIVREHMAKVEARMKSCCPPRRWTSSGC